MSFRKGLFALGIGIFVNLLFFSNVRQDNLKIEIANDFTYAPVDTVDLSNFDVKQLNYLHYRIDRFIKYWNISGASLAVAKDGRVIYKHGFGLADTTKKIAVRPDHMFRIASVSKLLTAVSIMQLSENGQLSLNDKVFGKDGILNFGIYTNYRDKNMEKIRVKHLLNHSGGWTLRYGDPLFNQHIIAKRLGRKEPLSSEDVIEYVLKKRLHFRPGTSSYYSNLGFVILGKVIEAASGMPYEMYVQSHILHPLGIYDMHLGKNTHDAWLPKEVRYYEQPDALPISASDGSGQLVRKCDGGNNLNALAAAGAWIATSESILKLVLAIDGDGKPFDMLSKASIEAMTKPDPNGFSPYGWRRTTKYGEWIRTGTLAGSTCLVKKAPNGLTYVMLCNTSTWRGSDFPFIMKRFLDGQLARVDGFKVEKNS